MLFHPRRKPKTHRRRGRTGRRTATGRTPGVVWDGVRWDGMEWDGMGWIGMGWGGMGWGEARRRGVITLHVGVGVP